MLEHSQALLLSSKMHAIFGITLLLAGLTRILELFLVPLLQLRTGFQAATLSEADQRNAQSDALADISAIEHIRPLVRVLPLHILFVSNGPLKAVCFCRVSYEQIITQQCLLTCILKLASDECNSRTTSRYSRDGNRPCYPYLNGF